MRTRRVIALAGLIAILAAAPALFAGYREGNAAVVIGLAMLATAYFPINYHAAHWRPRRRG